MNNIRLFIKWVVNRPMTGGQHGSPKRRMSWTQYRNFQKGKLVGIKRLAANRARGKKAWETRKLTLTFGT